MGPGAGYRTAGDADPIGLTTLEVRYRRVSLTGAARHYYALGAGAGLAFAPAIHDLAVPVMGEIGAQLQSSRLLLSLGLRGRLVLLVGSGSPPLDALSSLQLVLGFGLAAQPGP